ncbi:MAG TPA: hypothetical protein DDY71_08590, partial [Spirochaetia bacterium]|nr:hypothetical protein [Spirochaetia bacterium]HBI37687.1 hypothetical protein [Spirochaetia bacterium]
MGLLARSLKYRELFIQNRPRGLLAKALAYREGRAIKEYPVSEVTIQNNDQILPELENEIEL